MLSQVRSDRPQAGRNCSQAWSKRAQLFGGQEQGLAFGTYLTLTDALDNFAERDAAGYSASSAFAAACACSARAFFFSRFARSVGSSLPSVLHRLATFSQSWSFSAMDND